MMMKECVCFSGEAGQGRREQRKGSNEMMDLCLPCFRGVELGSGNTTVSVRDGDTCP